MYRLVSRASTGIWFPLIHRERYQSWWHSASPRTYTTFAYQLNASVEYRSQWSTAFARPTVNEKVPGAIVAGARKIDTTQNRSSPNRNRRGRDHFIWAHTARRLPTLGARKRVGHERCVRTGNRDGAGPRAGALRVLRGILVARPPAARGAEVPRLPAVGRRDLRHPRVHHHPADRVLLHRVTSWFGLQPRLEALEGEGIRHDGHGAEAHRRTRQD